MSKVELSIEIPKGWRKAEPKDVGKEVGEARMLNSEGGVLYWDYGYKGQFKVHEKGHFIVRDR